MGHQQPYFSIYFLIEKYGCCRYAPWLAVRSAASGICSLHSHHFAALVRGQLILLIVSIRQCFQSLVEYFKIRAQLLHLIFY